MLPPNHQNNKVMTHADHPADAEHMRALWLVRDLANLGCGPIVQRRAAVDMRLFVRQGQIILNNFLAQFPSSRRYN